MANVFNTLSLNNPYKDIIIPLVQAYGSIIDPSRKANPHEVWLAASLLTLRTRTWGENMPAGDGGVRGNTTGGGGGIGHNKACCQKKLCTCNTSAARGAQADGPGAANPNTTLIQTLEEQLRTISMFQPNAYQDWSEAVAYFYESVGPFLSYFQYTYKGGAYSDFYETGVDFFRHPEGNKIGLDFSLLQSGSDGPDKAETTIDVGTLITGLDLPFPAPYIATYRNATTLDVFWINENNYVQPTVDGGAGVTSNYHPVNGISNNQTDNALILEVVINDLGVGYTVTNLGTQLVVDAPVTGSLPATLFNFDSYALAAWSVNFKDGDDDPSTASAEFSIDYWCPTPAIELQDRFFIIYATDGSSTMLWYNVDGAGTEPTVPADSKVPIAITSADSAAGVQKASQLVLDGLGFLTTALSGTKIICTYTTPAPVIDLDEGTALIGVNYAYSDTLKGSDGSTLASGITSDEEFAELWNTLRVPFEETQGYTYPYLDSRMIGIGDPIAVEKTGSPCGVCFRAVGKAHWSGSGGTITGVISCKDCDTAASAGVFRALAYQSEGISNYNTPGNIFIAADGRQANLIPLSEITQ